MLCLVFVDGDLLLAMEDGDLLAAMQDITPLHQKAFMRAVHAVVELGIKPPTNLWEYKVSLSVFNCLRMILYTALIWNAKNALPYISRIFIWRMLFCRYHGERKNSQK